MPIVIIILISNYIKLVSKSLISAPNGAKKYYNKRQIIVKLSKNLLNIREKLIGLSLKKIGTSQQE